MMDDEGKHITYSLVKDLIIDLSALPALPPKPLVKDSIPPKVNPNIEPNIKSQVKGYSNTNPQSNHPIIVNPIGINSGGSCGTNREWEVGSK